MTKALETRKKSEDPPGKLKEDLDQFFTLDKNKDNLISFSEYKWMWVEPRQGKSASIPASGSTFGQWAAWFPNPAELYETARSLAQDSPYAVLSGAGVTTAAVYVG